jgi:hypothetical protein
MDRASSDILSYESASPGNSRSRRDLNRAALPLTLCGAAIVLLGARLPVTDFLLALVGYTCVIVGGFTWLLRIRSRNMRVPLVIIVLLALHAAHVPSRLTFYICKPLLDHWAKSQNTPNLPASVRIGPYELYDIDHIDAVGQPSSAIRGYLRGAQGLSCEGGLVYSPQGEPSHRSSEFYVQVSGDWYFLYNDN